MQSLTVDFYGYKKSFSHRFKNIRSRVNRVYARRDNQNMIVYSINYSVYPSFYHLNEGGMKEC